MTLHEITVWIRSDWTHAGFALVMALNGYSLAWAAVKAAIVKNTGEPLPRNGVTITLDVLAELSNNLAGALNRLSKETGGRGLFGATPPAGPRASDPAPRPPGQSGRASVGALFVLLVASLALVVACPRVIREPALPPPPSGCAQGATVCHEGAPWRCGPGGAWSQADRRCDRLAAGDAAVAVCCSTPSAIRPGVMLHACVPAALCAAGDGGAR